ncbi:MAG: rRNA maturation RNase YbeY [Christensenellales bacterium]|jgi:probable rRNA maturation factor
MTIRIDNEQERVEVHPGTEAMLENAVRTALARTGAGDLQVSVLLVDDEAIRDMNREYRGMDRSTDVLSFPMLSYLDGEYDDQLVFDTDPETGEVLLGDVVISIETAVRQADEYGHSIERELAYLAVHGVLHLRGYDHENESDRRGMRAAEEEILALIGLVREPS